MGNGQHDDQRVGQRSSPTATENLQKDHNEGVRPLRCARGDRKQEVSKDCELPLSVC
jgi:hypothetical protein